jgi:hypothetical protein
MDLLTTRELEERWNDILRERHTWAERQRLARDAERAQSTSKRLSIHAIALGVMRFLGVLRRNKPQTRSAQGGSRIKRPYHA